MTLGKLEVGVLIVLYCVFNLFVVPGEVWCSVCRGYCFALVKDLINVLVEYGEIEPNEEVGIVVMYWLLIMLFLEP